MEAAPSARRPQLGVSGTALIGEKWWEADMQPIHYIDEFPFPWQLWGHDLCFRHHPLPRASILYRAHRLRFVLFAPIAIAFTVGMFALGYDGLIRGDHEVRGAWLCFPLCALFLWFDWIIFAKLIWPPEMEVSLTGIRWSNRSMLEPDTRYDWQNIEGPEQGFGSKGVSLLEIVVKTTGRRLRLPPSHFGATYDEMAAVITAAKNGHMISPQQWRHEHPQHPLKDWLINWGLPIAGGVLIAALVVSRR